MAVICKNCGFSNADGDEFCGNCGKYLEFTGVSADSFILRSEEWPGVAGDALRAQINGIQIIASVPEPASIGLLALAGLGLLSRRRRR